MADAKHKEEGADMEKPLEREKEKEKEKETKDNGWEDAPASGGSLTILNSMSPRTRRKTDAGNHVRQVSLNSLTIVAVIEKMGNKLNKPEVQKWGLYRLLQIQNGPMLREVIPSVVAAMKAHPQNWKIQRSGCEFLWRSSAAEASNKTEILKLGGGDAIICAMITHRTSDVIIAWAAGALGNLAIGDDIKIQLRKKGVVGLLITSMRQHLTNEWVQEFSLGALEALAHLPANTKEIVTQGGIGAIINAMYKHPQNDYLQRYACSILQNLAYSVPNINQVVEHGGLKAIIKALRLHVTSELVYEFGCGALANMSVLSGVAKSLKEEGVALLLQKAKDTFTDIFVLDEVMRLLDVIES